MKALSANEFIRELGAFQTKINAEKNQKFLHNPGKDNLCLGIPMGKIFETAKKYKNLSSSEIVKLLQNKYYEIRMGAVSVLDFIARDKKTEEEKRKEIFDLYLKHHDRINNWDLVDRSAPHVVCQYLFDKSRKPLYRLAKSKDPMERRTAIVSTQYFIQRNDLDETFEISEILIQDPEEGIQKAIGSWMREAGKKDEDKLFSFLDKHSKKLSRIALRTATEKLDRKQRDFYLRSEPATKHSKI
ncbi:DNA alkylation repair protein [Leptospira kmetyi]|uniref:DNA alkylation repair protein n=1 Tax=Leptospira kmetyi TaxID=408139 RepID=UPI0002897B4F|nr:DNA alkylation repair protein [Leptospira kmetyi]EQA51916.1 DNA alkylation repair enzyme [Leptospira kmetyi serovar Malaysia str. Bejo-Iso9]